MASKTKLDSNGRQGFRIRFYSDSKQREIYVQGIGRRDERIAETIRRHCEDIVKAKLNNVAPPPEALAWATTVQGQIRNNLVKWGLTDAIAPKLNTDVGRLLGAFTTAYINGRTDVKQTTKINYLQTKRLLIEYFEADKPLKSITMADAERWRRWMLDKSLAVATVSKHCKRAKTMLAEAVKDRLLSESPFADLKGGDESNASRQFLVDLDITARVLAACPDADWRLIFTLARFGGLRCPSEVLGLKWTDVDWDGNRIRIDSPKTGRRFVPIFPEIRKALDESFAAAAKDAVYCVIRYRGSKRNLRTQLCRILVTAKVERWPKLFVNLRSTRRTELQDKFLDHVVNKWLGHSGKVAEKHYLQVTDEHWQTAAAFGSLTGSLITNNHEPSSSSTETTKPSELLGSDGARCAVIANLVTPTGSQRSIAATPLGSDRYEATMTGGALRDPPANC